MNLKGCSIITFGGSKFIDIFNSGSDGAEPISAVFIVTTLWEELTLVDDMSVVDIVVVALSGVLVEDSKKTDVSLGAFVNTSDDFNTISLELVEVSVASVDISLVTVVFSLGSVVISLISVDISFASVVISVLSVVTSFVTVVVSIVSVEFSLDFVVLIEFVVSVKNLAGSVEDSDEIVVESLIVQIVAEITGLRFSLSVEDASSLSLTT